MIWKNQRYINDIRILLLLNDKRKYPESLENRHVDQINLDMLWYWSSLKRPDILLSSLRSHKKLNLCMRTFFYFFFSPVEAYTSAQQIHSFPIFFFCLKPCYHVKLSNGPKDFPFLIWPKKTKKLSYFAFLQGSFPVKLINSAVG